MICRMSIVKQSRIRIRCRHYHAVYTNASDAFSRQQFNNVSRHDVDRYINGLSVSPNDLPLNIHGVRVADCLGVFKC